MGGYDKLKKHDFFKSIDWLKVPEQKPPELQPYLPATNCAEEGMWSQYKVNTLKRLNPFNTELTIPSIVLGRLKLSVGVDELKN